MAVIFAYEVAVATEPVFRAAFGRLAISSSWNCWSKKSEQCPCSSFGKHLYEPSAEAYGYGQDPDFQTR